MFLVNLKLLSNSKSWYDQEFRIALARYQKAKWLSIDGAFWKETEEAMIKDGAEFFANSVSEHLDYSRLSSEDLIKRFNETWIKQEIAKRISWISMSKIKDKSWKETVSFSISWTNKTEDKYVFNKLSKEEKEEIAKFWSYEKVSWKNRTEKATNAKANPTGEAEKIYLHFYSSKEPHFKNLEQEIWAYNNAKNPTNIEAWKKALEQTKTWDGRNLLKTIFDENIWIKEKLKAVVNSPLGAAWLVVFWFMFLFGVIGWEMSFGKRLAIILGSVVMMWAASASWTGLNDIIDAFPDDNKVDSVKTDAVKYWAVVGASFGSDIPQSVKNSLGVYADKTSNESYWALKSLNTNSQDGNIFKDRQDLIDSTLVSFRNNPQFYNIKLSDIKDGKLTDEQLKSIWFTNNWKWLVKGIDVNWKKQEMTAEHFNNFFLPALLAVKDENVDKTIWDVFEENPISNATQWAIDWAKDLIWEPTDSTKMIAVWVWTILLGFPIIGGLIAWVWLWKNLTFKEYLNDLIWDNETTEYYEYVNSKISSLRDETLKTKTKNLFSDMNAETDVLLSMDKLISESKQGDKKILEDLKNRLLEMVVLVIDSYFNQVRDKFNQLTNDKEDLEKRLEYLSKLDNLLDDSKNGLTDHKKAELKLVVAEKRKQIMEYIKTNWIQFNTEELKWLAPSLTASTWALLYLNNEKIKNEVQARLNDLQVSDQTWLKQDIEKSLLFKWHEEQLESLEDLKRNYNNNPTLISIINLVSLDKFETELVNEIQSIEIPNNLTQDWINTLFKKLHSINEKFKNEKVNKVSDFSLLENKWYNFDSYNEVLNTKKAELIKKAKELWLTSIRWWEEFIEIFSFERKIQEKKEKLINEKRFYKLFSTIKYESNAWSDINDLLDKYNEFLSYKDKISTFEKENSELKNSVISKINNYLGYANDIFSKYQTNSTNITWTEVSVLKDRYAIIEKYESLLCDNLQYNVSWYKYSLNHFIKIYESSNPVNTNQTDGTQATPNNNTPVSTPPQSPTAAPTEIANSDLEQVLNKINGMQKTELKKIILEKNFKSKEEVLDLLNTLVSESTKQEIKDEAMEILNSLK